MNDLDLDQITDHLWSKLQSTQSTALVVGNQPPDCLGYVPTEKPPYAVVIIGSLSPGGLLHFSNPHVLEALLEGKTVYLYEPGLSYHRHKATASPLLLGQLQSAERYLKQLGIQFYGQSCRGKLITQAMAQQLIAQGKAPPSGAILTPLARELLGGITS